MTDSATRPRLRDLGLAVGELPTGPHNAITDVAGVRVGHVTLAAGEGPLVPGQGPIRTGVTAILPHGGDLFREKVPAAAHTINGFGKTVGFEQVRELGALETPIILTNTLNVGLCADAVISYTNSEKGMRVKWNEYLFASVLTSRNAQPYTLLVASTGTVRGIHFGFVSTRMLIAVTLPVILSLFVQRYVVRGLTLGAIKG